MLIKIILSSAYKDSINRFLNILLKILFYLDLPVKVNKKFKKFKKSKISVLKSPHVNKTAQEKFNNNNFKVEIFVYSNNNKLIIKILKKIILSLNYEIFIKIIYNTNVISNNKYVLLLSKKSLNVNYLFFLDYLGEIYFYKNNS